MSKILSILIPTLASRNGMLDRLMGILEPQRTSEVEILLLKDKGKSSIGAKRNSLVASAVSEFTVFIDDDDTVVPTYISTILSAIEANPKCDCVRLEGNISVDGKPTIERFIGSKEYFSWQYDDVKHLFTRPPYHLNPIRREHALKAMFPDQNHREDVVFSDRVRQYIVTEAPTEGVLYHYLYRTEKDV